MENIAIVFIGEIVLVVMSLIFVQYDLFSPSFIVNVLCICSTSIAMMQYDRWNYNYSLKTALIYLSGLLVFNLMEWITKAYYFRRQDDLEDGVVEKCFSISKWKIQAAVVYCILAGIIQFYGVISLVRNNGYSGGIDFSAVGSYYHRLAFMDSRVKNSMFINIIGYSYSAIMYILIYYFLDAVIMKGKKIREQIICLVPVVFSVPLYILKSSRMQLIMIASYIIFVSYVMSLQKRKWKGKQKNFFAYIRIGVTAVIVVIVAFYLLSGIIGRATTHLLREYIAIYIGGPMIHFDQYVNNPPLQGEYWGQETFGNIYSFFNKLHITNAAFSTQLEVRKLNAVSRGNVYTFFRRPLQDFGILGMYVVTALTSWLFSKTYYKKIYRRAESLETIRTIIVYGYLFRIILVFWYDNYLYAHISAGMILFYVIFRLIFWIMTDSVHIEKKKVTIRRNSL